MKNQSIEIDLLFKANTQAAQKNVQSLMQSLNQISTKTKIGIDGDSLSGAVQSAQQLQIYLQKAVDVNTGKLDLMKLRDDLRSSGQTLQGLANNLQAVGPVGEQAFLKLANAVSQASVPMVKTNGLVKEFITTLANTAKWQIASSAIHGIMGAFNGAISYAKELNAAMTDIQIVTGYSDHYMSNFAETAGRAAERLSTTTTEYAKAALIFYQQGLSGKAVEERTETVIKLSQVTGQSAQVVSDQMTAIWNNFDNGSSSLEYYADVLARLGAQTAASTSEISTALQRFSSVADTVGLSYEYAAATVATVIDKTRQSPEVVGTAFKTILARLEGLSLGDTLEGGVDLNKYSEALKKVGVNVLDARGQLRDMDDILDDLGSKWEGLGETTQVALAQVVGGTKQYTHLLSIMNNWKEIKENVEDAKDATMELVEQQEIWSKSYEASAKKLAEAKNQLYQSFITDKGIILFNDILAKSVDSITIFIDKIGGIGPLILTLSAMFSRTLFPLVGSGFKKLTNTISVWTGKAAKDVAAMQGSMSVGMAQMINNPNLTSGMRDQILLSDQLIKIKQRVMLESKNMSATQRAEAESRLAVTESLIAETMELLKQQDALEKAAQAAKNGLFEDNVQRKQAAIDYASAQYTAKKDVKLQAQGMDSEAERQEYIDTVVQGATTRTVNDLSTQRQQVKTNIQQAKTESVNMGVEIEDKKAQLATAQLNYSKNTDEDSGAGALIKNLEDELRMLEEKKSAADEIIKNGEIELQQLKDMIALRKEINSVMSDTEKLEEAVVGTNPITSIAAGSIDDEGHMSARLAKDDTAIDSTAQKAASSQMSAVNQAFNGPKAQMGDGDTIAIEASIANYEKLYDTISQQNVLHSKLQAAAKSTGASLKSLSKETAAVEKAGAKLTPTIKANIQKQIESTGSLKGLKKEQKAYGKALKDQYKMNQTQIKNLKNSKNAYMDLAKSARASGGDIKKLEQAFKLLDGNVADQKKGMEIIEKTFNSLGNAADAVGNDLQLMADKMEQALRDAGYSDEWVDELTRALRELAQQAPITATAADNAGQSMSNMGIKTESFAQKFSTGAMSIMTFTGNLQSLNSGLMSLSDAFEEGTSWTDKLQGFLSFSMSALPMVIFLTELLSKVKKKETEETLKGLPVKATEKGSIIAETLAKWGLTSANLAASMSNPFTIAMALIAVGCIAAMLVMINKQKKATEESTAANYKLTDSQEASNNATTEASIKTSELADSWIEQMGVMDDLIAKYNRLSDAEKQSLEATQDIIDSVPDLVKSYDELADSVFANDQNKMDQYNQLRKELNAAAAAGDVNGVQKARRAIDLLLADPTQEQTRKGADAAKSNILSDFYDAGLNDVSGVDSSTANVTYSNIFVEDLETDSKLWTKLESAGLVAKRDSDGYSGLALRTDTLDAFMADYEKMLEIYEEASKDPEMVADSGYQVLKKIIETTAESYNQAKQLQESEKYQAVAKAAMTGTDATDITNFAEYQEYRAGVAAEANVDEKYVNEYFENNAATKDFELMQQRLDHLQTKGSDFGVDDLNKLTPEQQKLFLEIDINKYQSENAINAAISMAQAEADKQKITVQLEAIGSIRESLKEEGMTEADYQAIRDSGFNWGGGVNSFYDFIQMSYDDQQSYLTRMEVALQAGKIATIKQQRKEAQNGLNNIRMQLKGTQQGTEEYNQLLKEERQLTEDLENAKADLIIAEEVLQNMRIEAVGLDISEVQEYADTLQDAAKNSKILSKDLEKNSAVATTVATATTRMNRGIEALNENIIDWADILQNSSNSSQEYSQALGELRTAMSDVLDVDEQFLSSSFLTNKNNLELMRQAAEGSAEAINKLAKAASRDILFQATIDSDIQTEVMKLHDALINKIPDLKIGASLSDDEIINQFQNIINKSKMTVDEAQAYFNSLGYEPNFVMHEEQVPLSGTKTTTTVTKVGTDEATGFQYAAEQETVTQPFESGETYPMMVPLLSADGTPTLKSVTKKTSGAMNNFSSQNSGGSSGKTSKAQKVDKTARSDIAKRYKEVEDSISDVNRALEESSQLSDRLYGAKRLKNLETQNKLIAQEVNLLKQKNKQAKEYLQQDQADLINAAAELGVEFKFDESTGNILNYEEIMNALYDELARREEIANSYAGGSEERQSDYIENNVDPLKKAISNLQSKVDTYDETKELTKDLDSEITTKLNEWQDNNAEALSLKLELNLSVNESELKQLEYYLNEMADDFFKMAESAALLAGSGGSKGKLEIIDANLKAHKDSFEETIAAYNSYSLEDSSQRWLSDEAYYSSLEELRTGIYNNLTSLLELDATMKEYYGNTLAAAGEELAKFTSQMEHQSSVLDHFSSIMSTIGKDTNYKQMGVILQGQAKLLSDQYAVAKANFEMLEAESTTKYKLWQDALKAEEDAIAAGDTEAAQAAKIMVKLYKDEYDAALQATTDAQNAQLELAQSWGDALKAILENTLKDLDSELEKVLTGGSSFDNITKSMERTRSLQEEYLTTTNKIYETNKMIRTTQQAIDKTTNTVAKQRLQQHIKETQQLQNQAKLSTFELKTQQAKYDLLLAKIALEEAQNTKSVVRLQRDAEGNFGYVYTADINAITESQQRLEDASNALYNIGLEGANNYAEKMIQLDAEMYAELTELHSAWQNGDFESREEYEQAVAELEEYWREKRIEYSHLYQIALTTDSAIIRDSWSKDFKDMTLDTEDWEKAIEDYVYQVMNTFTLWEQQMETIVNDTVGKDLDTLATKVGIITTKSEELRSKIMDGDNSLLQAFKDEFDAVSLSTSNYGLLRQELDKNIESYKTLATWIGNALSAQKAYDSSTWHSLQINGQNVGHYDTAEKAAQAAWNTYYVSGNMSEKDVKNITIIDRYGSVSKVGDYWKSDWAKREEKVENNSLLNTLGSLLTGVVNLFSNGPENPDDEEPQDTPDPYNYMPTDPAYTYVYVGSNGVWRGPYGSAKDAAKGANYAHVAIQRVVYEKGGDFEDGMAIEHCGQASDYAEKSSTDNTVTIGGANGTTITPPGAGTIPGPVSPVNPRPAGFDTGGYTGTWGSNGKIALLHEKELVLNAEDTTNFLMSLEVLREIVNTINLHSLSAQLGGLLSNPNYIKTDNSRVLEQQVHIEASFPAVTERTEIEEAFNNLINRASQYVNRK